jgi:hypothetical protein
MKKAIVALCFVLFITTVGTSLYSYKISTELGKIKELNKELNSGKHTAYAKIESKKLCEPLESEFEDTLERIKMLRQHLSYDPSPEWVGSVIGAAEYEILQLSRELELARRQ